MIKLRKYQKVPRKNNEKNSKNDENKQYSKQIEEKDKITKNFENFNQEIIESPYFFIASKTETFETPNENTPKSLNNHAHINRIIFNPSLDEKTLKNPQKSIEK